MDGDKDKPMSEIHRWLDYYRTPAAKKNKKMPSKVVDKRDARRFRRRVYKIKSELENEWI